MAEMLPAGPADDGVYHVYQMCYARRAGSVHEMLMFRDMHDGPMPLDYNVWILRNAHRTVLVDTGFGARAAAERNRILDFEPADGLRRIGIDPDAIEDIVITHLHYDHAGGLHRFGKARFHIQDDELRYTTGRCMCDPIARRAFDIEDVTTLVRRLYADRVVFHAGDDDFLPGLTLHGFPGHSACVMGVSVQTPRGPVLLASDSTHYYANVLGSQPFALTIDLSQTLASYRKLMDLAGGAADRLIPGHDPKVRRLFPAVSVNGIELLQLHETAKPYDRADLARTDNF